MNIKQLKAFMAVARTMSFAEAANQLHLSQPALSLTIKNLEESLGGRLLTRTTRTIALTPEGHRLQAIARQLLAHWDNAAEEMHQRFALKTGKIALAAMPSFAASILPSALLNYRTRYPGIDIEIHDVLADTVVDMVRSGRIEIGVSFEPGVKDDLMFHPLFNDQFKAVVPRDHPLAQLSAVSWQQLLAHDFITLQRPSSVRAMIENALAREGIELSVALDAHQLATIGQLVSVGLGVAVVPELCEQQMTAQGAVCIPVHSPVVSQWVGVVSKPRSLLSMAAAGMLDVLIETLQNRESAVIDHDAK